MTKRYFFLALTIMAFSGSFCFAQTGTIHPFANVPLCYPTSGVAMDKNGNYYYCDSGLFEMKKRSPAGVITVVAGNGTAGYTGDGGPATAASITVAQAIAIDPKGNLYFSCMNTHTIRKIDTSGIITTVAGTLSYGYTGDGGLADTATLGQPFGIATDEIGNVYFTDGFYEVIRKIDTSGIINTIAGIPYSASGYDGFSGDGGPATNASFDGVFGIAIDKNQNIYVCDVNNYKLRKINAAGIISTVAGVDSGTFELTGMGGPADSANIQPPYYVVADTSGNILFTDQYLIYRISTAGIINVVGGEGSASDVGYTGPANLTHFGNVSGLAIGPDNNLYINDGYNGVVLRETIAPSTNPDTFYTYIDTSACSTITLYAVTTDTSATTLYTYFGDGTWIKLKSCGEVKK